MQIVELLAYDAVRNNQSRRAWLQMPRFHRGAIPTIKILSAIGLALASDCAGAGGWSGIVTGSPGGAPRIDHVVIIVQENRSPDNLFHGLPNADIANSGVD